MHGQMRYTLLPDYYQLKYYHLFVMMVDLAVITVLNVMLFKWFQEYHEVLHSWSSTRLKMQRGG